MDEWQIDAWKARHEAKGIWMGNGEKVTYSVKLPTKVIYKKPPPPPPPAPRGGAGGGRGNGGGGGRGYPPTLPYIRLRCGQAKNGWQLKCLFYGIPIATRHQGKKYAGLFASLTAPSGAAALTNFICGRTFSGHKIQCTPKMAQPVWGRPFAYDLEVVIK